MMKCAGDDGEYCGGAQTISLYKKCDGTCENSQVGVVGNNSASAAARQDVPATAPSSGPVDAPSESSGYPASSSDAAARPADPPAQLEPKGTNGYVTPADSSSPPSATAQSSSSDSSNGDSDSSAPASTDGPAATGSSAPEGVSTIPQDGTPGSSTTSGAAPLPTNFDAPTNSSTTVTLPAGWRDAGCHVDPIRPRALTYWGWFGQPMTSSGCAKYCDKKGYSFAGTENGGQCFCGNVLTGGKEAEASECKTKCKGDAKETCGGPKRLSLFTKLAAAEGDGEKKKMMLKERAVHRHVGRAHRASL